MLSLYSALWAKSKEVTTHQNSSPVEAYKERAEVKTEAAISEPLQPA